MGTLTGGHPAGGSCLFIRRAVHSSEGEAIRVARHAVHAPPDRCPYRCGKSAPLVTVSPARRIHGVRRHLLVGLGPRDAVACRTPFSVPVTVWRAITARITGSDRGVPAKFRHQVCRRAREQATELVGRLPPSGLFELFIEQEGLADKFRYGWEADGTLAAPWGWEDLQLSRFSRTARADERRHGLLLRTTPKERPR